jgi:hypothetical protein
VKTDDRELRMIIGRYPKLILVAAVLSLGVTLSAPHEVLRAQEVDKPAIPPQPRTINLTQEQRFIIRENVKDLAISKASKDAPPDIVLHGPTVGSGGESGASTLAYVFHQGR